MPVGPGAALIKPPSCRANDHQSGTVQQGQQCRFVLFYLSQQALEQTTVPCFESKLAFLDSYGDALILQVFQQLVGSHWFISSQDVFLPLDNLCCVLPRSAFYRVLI